MSPHARLLDPPRSTAKRGGDGDEKAGAQYPHTSSATPLCVTLRLDAISEQPRPWLKYGSLASGSSSVSSHPHATRRPLRRLQLSSHSSPPPASPFHISAMGNDFFLRYITLPLSLYFKPSVITLSHAQPTTASQSKICKASSSIATQLLAPEPIDGIELQHSPSLPHVSKMACQSIDMLLVQATPRDSAISSTTTHCKPSSAAASLVLSNDQPGRVSPTDSSISTPPDSTSSNSSSSNPSPPTSQLLPLATPADPTPPTYAELHDAQGFNDARRVQSYIRQLGGEYANLKLNATQRAACLQREPLSVLLAWYTAHPGDLPARAETRATRKGKNAFRKTFKSYFDGGRIVNIAARQAELFDCGIFEREAGRVVEEDEGPSGERFAERLQAPLPKWASSWEEVDERPVVVKEVKAKGTASRRFKAFLHRAGRKLSRSRIGSKSSEGCESSMPSEPSNALSSTDKSSSVSGSSTGELLLYTALYDENQMSSDEEYPPWGTFSSWRSEAAASGQKQSTWGQALTESPWEKGPARPSVI